MARLFIYVYPSPRCLAKVLGRKQIRPRYRDDVGKYVVDAQSKTLYGLLRKPVDLDRFKKYIEHCDRCVASFLRASQTQKEASTRESKYLSTTPI
jgi:hypothetical protein